MHHRHLLLGREPLDRSHVALADLPQRRRRWDREPAIQQKPHHQPLGLQLRDVPGEKDPIDRPHLERDPLPKVGSRSWPWQLPPIAPRCSGHAAHLGLYRRPSVVTLDGGYAWPPPARNPLTGPQPTTRHSTRTPESPPPSEAHAQDQQRLEHPSPSQNQPTLRTTARRYEARSLRLGRAKSASRCAVDTRPGIQGRSHSRQRSFDLTVEANDRDLVSFVAGSGALRLAAPVGSSFGD